MYKLAKQRDKSSKDLVPVKRITDEDEKVFLLEEDIKQRWMRYFYKLFNVDYEKAIDFDDLSTLNKNKDFCFHQHIINTKVRDALKKIMCGKAVGLVDKPIEV